MLGSPTWTSACSFGAKWRTLGNGAIEVEGLGVPLAETTGWHQDANAIQSVWAQWQGEIQAAAAATGLPARWILAIMIIESRGKNHPPNSAGYGGLMALSPTSAGIGLGRKGTHEDVMDPPTAIRAGAGFMLHQGKAFGMELATIAASYNAGSPKCSPTTRCKSTIDGSWTFDGTTAENSLGMVEDCTQGRSSNYALRAVRINNSCIELGIGAEGFGLGRWGLLVASVAAGAGLVWLATSPEGERLLGQLDGWLTELGV